MNQHQSPYAGIHRARVGRCVLRLLVALSLVLLGSAVSISPASATTNGAGSAAAWPAHWSAYTYADGRPIGDVNGDTLPPYLDLASAGCAACAGRAPSVAFTSDGADAFFRIRLATDITDTAQHGSSGGAFMVQIADANGRVRVVVGVDGADPADRGVYVADPLAAVVTKIHESPRHPGSRMRVIDAEDGSGHFFLDFQVPLTVIDKVSDGAVTASTPIKLYSGSSAETDLAPVNLATINADFMLGNVATVDFAALATVRLVPLQYPVAFDSAGGSPVAAQLVTEGFPAAAPALPTREGYRFGGWYTGGSAYDFSTAVSAPTRIFAQWSRIGYSVTFHSAGGSAVSEQTVLYGDTVEVPTAPIRDDDAFLGWFPAAVGGKVLDLATRPVTAPTELYAHWREHRAPIRPAALPSSGGAAEDSTTPLARPVTVTSQSKRSTHSVVFYPNGGSSVASQTVAAGDTASVPSEPTRAGYQFKGWFATADGGPKWEFSTPIHDATTLYAHWSPRRGDGAGDPTGETVDPVADREQDGGTDGEQEGDGGDGPNGGTVLPNTGNQVSVGVLASAVMMLLVGFMLLRRDRRRLAEARDSE